MGANYYASQKFSEHWPETNQQPSWKNADDTAAREALIQELKRESALRITCVLATQPLQVIAVRTMAQFIGGESKYSGPFGGIQEILNENGILGKAYSIVSRQAGAHFRLSLMAFPVFGRFLVWLASSRHRRSLSCLPHRRSHFRYQPLRDR